MGARAILVSAALASVSACSLLVDTSGLDGAGDGGAEGASSGGDVPPGAPPVGGDAGTDSAAQADARSDADAGGSTYAATILADAPMAYYRMGATSGAIVKDEMGGPDLALTGGFTLGVKGALANDPDGAIRFDGSSAHGVVSGAGGRFDFAGTKPFTLEAWASWTVVAGSDEYQHVLGSSQTGGSSRAGTILYLSPVHGIAGFEWDPGTGQRTVGVPLPASGVFHHYVGVFDGAVVTMYLDGVMGDSTPIGGATMPARSNDLVVGADFDFFARLAGDLDEIAIYDHALSAADVGRHLAAARGP